MSKNIERVFREGRLSAEEIARDEDVRRKVQAEFSIRGTERHYVGAAKPSPPRRTSGQRKIDVPNCTRRWRFAERGVALPFGRTRHPHGHGGQAGRGAWFDTR